MPDSPWSSEENRVFPKALLNQLRKQGIDLELTRTILDNFNRGNYDHILPVKVKDIPVIDGKKIIDISGKIRFQVGEKEAESRLAALGLDPGKALEGVERRDGTLTFDRRSLSRLGLRLYPFLSYGILNGGSASSYVDIKKNQEYNPVLFSLCEKEFLIYEKMARNKAKGLVAAFLNEDSSPGPSFMELKLRSILIEALRYQVFTGTRDIVLWPCFQMTSLYNHEEIGESLSAFRKSPFLKDLIAWTGIDMCQLRSEVQPLIAAFTHSGEGKPRKIFSRANGKTNSPLPMPGGHGQNFLVLKEVYRELYRLGKRFAYLGNVDNLGYTVNPVGLAILALSGGEGAFEFAHRTGVDVKGGVLVIDQKDRINCVDIGPGISREEIIRVENSGKKVLFNCATGLFSLPYLIENIEEIVRNLPVRFSDQNKDAGRYSQAEQITWEVISLMDRPVICAVNKYSRFLAAKTAMETLMTSGVRLGDPLYPTDPDPEKDLKSLAGKLHTGLVDILSATYGLGHQGGAWVPRPAAELRKEMSNNIC
jgi:UTP--glucose-1-phosphate uridylyltransferase